MNAEIVKKRISRVLRVDSIDSTESDFLATHVPFRSINVVVRRGNNPDEIEKTEEEVYKDLFVDVEKKLYDKFPEYKERNNNFLSQGKIVLKFKTVGENRLESGIPIIMQVP